MVFILTLQYNEAMSRNERVSVFIDGSNFYHYLKSKEVGFQFNTGAWFNYKALVDFLVNEIPRRGH